MQNLNCTYLFRSMKRPTMAKPTENGNAVDRNVKEEDLNSSILFRNWAAGGIANAVTSAFLNPLGIFRSTCV